MLNIPQLKYVLSATIILLAISSAPSQASKRLLLPIQKNTVNVNISFNTQVPLTNNSQETINQLQRAARKLFYKMTLQECETLQEIIANTCTLKSLNVSSQLRRQGDGSKLVYLNGSARFIITLK